MEEVLYTPEEVEKLLFQYADAHGQLNSKHAVELFDLWVEQNVKKGNLKTNN